MRMTRPIGSGLCILAVLMQLLLPHVHAATWAERSGDPLAYALCGIGSAAGLADELREVLPAEVVAELDARHATPELPDCHACVSAHAVAALQATSTSLDASGTDAASTRTVSSAQQRNTHERPPVRGPPVSV
jgi:hypothetical protein